MPNLDINQFATNEFGLSDSGYVGSRGFAGSTGPLGTNGSVGAAGTGSDRPKIANIQVTDSGYTVLDDTAVSTSGGYIKITGSGFVSGCNVLINQTAATSVTFISSTEVRAQVPAMTAGGYIVYVINANGGTALSITGIQYSGTPAWTTTSGSLGSPSTQSSFTANLSATGDAPITYSVLSGSLPGGLSLSANTGVISGTTPTVANDTTYNFTVRATDAQLQDTDRAFSIAVIPSNAPATVEYLVVAGGGGGAYYGGGGGAGGFRTATGLAVSPGSAITVTVGAGGTRGTPSTNPATSGADSVFGSITSTGGGFGGTSGAGDSSYRAGGNGGSGGGGSTNGLVNNNGGTGISGQGFAGGGGTNQNTDYAGGGGGASEVGVSAYIQNGPSRGGNGLSSSISGSAVTYAGGGGGGGWIGSGAGGTGGGGAAGLNGSPGGTNTGGGGGGSKYGPQQGSTGAGNGGSGIVIIRYLNTRDAAVSTTGNPTITNTGGYRIYQWTSSGSITF